jgi:hypothetical protein
MILTCSPDISKVTALDDFTGITEFFDGCLIEQHNIADGGVNGTAL